MDTNAQQINSDGLMSPVIWHYETLPRRTKKALMFLSEEKWLKESGWKKVKNFFIKEIPIIADKVIR